MNSTLTIFFKTRCNVISKVDNVVSQVITLVKEFVGVCTDTHKKLSKIFLHSKQNTLVFVSLNVTFRANYVSQSTKPHKLPLLVL